MKNIITASMRGGRLGWLLSQAGKYLSIPFAIRFMNGRTPAGPLMGAIFVTYRCNSACTMCDYPQRAAGVELSTAELMTIIDEFTLINVSGIGFTGGEPLLRPDIYDLIAYTRSKGLPVTLNTNGLMLTDPAVAARLVAADPTNINVSLDSSRSELHDRLRGRSQLFRRTTAGLQQLAAALRAQGSTSTITAVTVVSEENVYELQEIADLAASLGAHRIGFMPLHHYGDDSCRVAATPRLAGVAERIAAIGSIPVENSARYIATMNDAFAGKPFPRQCNAGYTSLYVDPYGRVTPCLGYVQMNKWTHDWRTDGSLVAIWRSDGYARLRKELLQCRTCYLNCQAELNCLWPDFFY